MTCSLFIITVRFTIEPVLSIGPSLKARHNDSDLMLDREF